MDLGIAGRKALVMEASRGLGRAVAEALIREGVATAICARDKERLESTARAGGIPASDQTGYITGQAIACDGGLLQSI